MPQKKQPFRFRIPWLSGTHGARPATEPLPRRPKDRSKSPTTQPDANVPIQRAPAQSPSPTKTQGAPRAEPQKQSPSHPTQPATSLVTIESPVISPLPSPSRTSSQTQSSSPSHAGSPSRVSVVSSSPKTQPRPLSHLASDGAVEVPKPAAEESTPPASSASEQGKEKMVVSEPMRQEAEPKVISPLKAIPPKSPDTSFQPERMPTQQPKGSEPQAASSVPSSPVSKTEPPASQPQPPSPLASEPTSKVLKTIAEESTLPASSPSQEEKGKMAVAVSEPEAEPKIKSPLKIIPKSPETSSQPEKLSTRPAGILGNEGRSTMPETKKLELDNAAGISKAPLETQSKFLQSEEMEKVVREPIKVGKAKGTTTGQQIRRTIASASGTQAKDPFTRAFRADKRQHGARETVERKMMFATSNPSGKDIRVVSSAGPETRNVSNISPERPGSSNGEKAPLQKGIKDDISKFVHKVATVHPAQPMDDKQFSVITLAGDNRGATMHVGSESAKKEGSIHIYRAYKTDPEESNEVTTDGEEIAEKESHNSTKQDEVEKAYVNSNIQSINNSLMFHGSITERDPGVQLTLPQQPAEPIKLDEKRGHETRKAEFNISRADKLTYQPTVRRRCLRGLFLEPSDSDPDNPDKPRRHGCKVRCGNNKKGEDIEILRQNKHSIL